MLRWLKRIAIALGFFIALFGLMQLVPYGRTHTNPPTSKEPNWDSAATRELVVRACFNCHSNQTKWPWYANVAPFSWVVQRDVEDARDTLNFSEWDRPQPLADSSGTSVLQGNMPPTKYTAAHPEARLTHDEMVDLVRGLNTTMGKPAGI